MARDTREGAIILGVLFLIVYMAANVMLFAIAYEGTHCTPRRNIGYIVPGYALGCWAREPRDD